MAALFEQELTSEIPDESFRRFLYNGQITFIVAGSVGFILTLTVFIYEMINRRHIVKTTKRNRKWLLLWSMLTILSSVFTQILCVLYKIPETALDICPYTTHAAVK